MLLSFVSFPLSGTSFSTRYRVNGDDDMEPFDDDDENHYYGAASTGMSPGMRRVGI